MIITTKHHGLDWLGRHDTQECLLWFAVVCLITNSIKLWFPDQAIRFRPKKSKGK